jgi:hypothetical protein
MSLPSGDANSLDYQKRVVSFIDVLGFSALVHESSKDPIARAKIGKLISTDKLFERVFGTMFKFASATFFSDSFVLSRDASRAFYLIRETGYLCRHLLLQGFPCRGAITTGLLYHRERIVIGPALIAAYKLEQSVAIYPRVILDDATKELWREEFSADPAHRHLEAWVKRDRDGQHFLDIFNPTWTEPLPWTEFIESADLVPTEAADFLKAALKPIQQGLAAHRGNAKVYEKYAWLDAEYRERVAALG